MSNVNVQKQQSIMQGPRGDGLNGRFYSRFVPTPYCWRRLSALCRTMLLGTLHRETTDVVQARTVVREEFVLLETASDAVGLENLALPCSMAGDRLAATSLH
jgi:hypothetical protein